MAEEGRAVPTMHICVQLNISSQGGLSAHIIFVIKDKKIEGKIFWFLCLLL